MTHFLGIIILCNHKKTPQIHPSRPFLVTELSAKEEYRWGLGGLEYHKQTPDILGKESIFILKSV